MRPRTYPSTLPLQKTNLDAMISVGRMIFELWVDKAPKTCENFRCLCTGEKGETSSGIRRSYEGSLMHRVIKNFIIQGGDYTKFNGTGGESIYEARFEDEDLTGIHDRPGLLSMANAGKNTNGSQFFITCASAPHLNGNHVVFGELVSGFGVLRMIEREPIVDEKTHRPGLDIKIVKCGELDPADYVLVPEIEAAKEKKRRRSSSSASSSSSSNSSSDSSSTSSDHHHHRRRKNKTQHKSSKRSKHSEDHDVHSRDVGEGATSRKERMPASNEPPKPRIDAKGRTVKGRGAVRSSRNQSAPSSHSMDISRDGRSDRRDYRGRGYEYQGLEKRGSKYDHEWDRREHDRRGHFAQRVERTGSDERDRQARHDMDNELDRYHSNRDATAPSVRTRSDGVETSSNESRKIGESDPRRLVSYAGVTTTTLASNSYGASISSESQSQQEWNTSASTTASTAVQRKGSPTIDPARHSSPPLSPREVD